MAKQDTQFTNLPDAFAESTQMKNSRTLFNTKKGGTLGEKGNKYGLDPMGLLKTKQGTGGGKYGEDPMGLDAKDKGKKNDADLSLLEEAAMDETAFDGEEGGETEQTEQTE